MLFFSKLNFRLMTYTCNILLVYLLIIDTFVKVSGQWTASTWFSGLWKFFAYPGKIKINFLSGLACDAFQVFTYFD